MTRLTPLAHAELVAGLRRDGLAGAFPGSKHLYMVRGDLRLAIRNPHRGTISPGLLARISWQAEIDRGQWLGGLGWAKPRRKHPARPFDGVLNHRDSTDAPFGSRGRSG